MLQPLGQAWRLGRPLLQEQLQPRAQDLSLDQVHPALQGLEHALHRPLLPLVEGHAVDVHLPAHFRGFATVRPDGEHSLGFLHRTEVLDGGAFGSGSLVRGIVFGGGHRRVP